jgi:heme exporter protein CcmD
MLGKYAGYVIPAYVISALVIGALAADSLARARRWRAEVKKREQLLGREPDAP